MSEGDIRKGENLFDGYVNDLGSVPPSPLPLR
jgi:hypothetical protein